ncbi:MAG: TIM barrel protein [Chloroflexota bacterium]
MYRIATSSWALHGTLGQAFYEHNNGTVINRNEEDPNAMPLLDLPAFVAKDGVKVLEIVHFHFPSTEDSYLTELKASLDEAGVELANVLVDTGNLSNPNLEERQRDIDMTKGWQDVALKLGAGGNRIDCGTEPASPETIALSASALQELADNAAANGLHVFTENWRSTSLQPTDLMEIMRQADRPLKLCVDFGNAAKTDDKYETLAALLPHSNSLHCKGYFDGETLDLDEFHRSLRLVKEANFSGHVALIYDKYDGEWEKVLALKEAYESYFSEN